MNARVQFEPLNDLLAGTSTFRPFAYYDKNLDAIRVQILDCSIREHRLDQYLTVYYANRPGDVGAASVSEGKIVGFAIKGIGCLFHTLGLKLEGIISLSKILDGMVKEFPAHSTKFVLEMFNAWPENNKPREVQFPDLPPRKRASGA